jgi:UrcA family protein
MNKLANLAVIAAATLNLSAVAQPALAGDHAAWSPDAETASVKVNTKGLDLSTQTGAHGMLQRIHRAASTVCQDDQDDPIFRQGGYMSCVNDATDRAVAQLNSPTVTALNGGKSSTATMALASIR